MTRKKRPQPSKSEVRQQQLADMMSKAAQHREKNKNLIQRIRKDPSLADDVRHKLKADLWSVWNIPREILGQSASRRRYREHGRYSEELVTILFGTWEEFKRQAEIPFEDRLAVRKIKRNISKTLRAQEIANYADRYVKPWDGAYDSLDMQQECVTLAVGSDFHSKYLDPFARRVWLDVIRDEQPDGLRFNGDGPDFPALSRHRQLPGHFLLSVQDEVDVWKSFMGESREACPDADLKWILGNHDIRLVTAMADAAPAYSSLRSIHFNEMFDLDPHRIGLVARSTFLNPTAQMRKNDIAQNWETLLDAEGRPFWTTVHGFLTGKNAPTAHMERFGTFGTNGHLHDERVVSGGSLATGALRWYQTGCMAWPRAVAANYIPGPIEATGWSIQFILVHLYPHTRHVHVEPAHIGEHIATFRDYVWEILPEEEAVREQMMEV